ncbi:MAG: hypothetical protein FWD81_01680 [Methanomassiliicoccaceae archaeon]|nr:hypothetical protein [Methanomassiliicoccaceae archaeon]
MGKNTEDGAGFLSFLGKRKVEVCTKDKKECVISNIFSAIRYTLLISMLLWWIPIVGQALAGYVGGRKAGTPARGMVATLASVLVLIGLMTIISSGIIGGLNFLNSEPRELVEAIGMDFPLLGWLLAGILWYMQAFFAFFGGTTSMKVNIYIITVVFGLIGGVIADQHAKEVARGAPKDTGRTFMPRSLAAYVQGKKLGFENFDDRLSIQRSKVPEQKIVTVHKTLVRKPAAREEPVALPAADATPAAQEAEQRESPFAGLIHRAEKNDPERERVRHGNSKEDLEYV